MVKRKTRKSKKQTKSKKEPTTIMGMAYQEFRRYKKKTKIG